jgi:hypothetical protein
MPDAKLTAVLPSAIGSYARDFGAPASPSRLHFDSLIARAAEVIEGTSESSSPEDGYAAAAKVMLGSCDVLLAVWDGRAARGKGGTAEVVALAREMGKSVVIVPAGGTDEQ